MYLLLISIHAVFFFIAYLLSNILMQWAFVLLLIFFLLYFSPLFFSNKINESNTGIRIHDLWISPKKSILIPLFLTYFGIYVLAFTVTRDLGANFDVHIYILLLIFLVFGGYMFAFNWNTSFFRDALRFHLICSYITIFAQLVYFFVLSGDITSIHIIFSIVTIGFSSLFFAYFQDENMSIFLTFLLSIVISVDTVVVFLFWDLHIFTIIWLTGLIDILIFEFMPRVRILQQFTEPSRVLLLSILLWLSVLLMFSPIFSYFHFVYFLPIFPLFLFSIHVRYCNYISYSVAIVVLFFLYSYLFSSLLYIPDLLSALLFIFFFSFCIIGNTYFWEEKYPYDFSLLHYTSIGFSSVGALYSLFFVAWGVWFSLFLACSLFLLAGLFLLSYFRFQYR